MQMVLTLAMLWHGMQVVLTLAMSVLSPGDLHGFDCCMTLDSAVLPLLLRTLCGQLKLVPEL